MPVNFKWKGNAEGYRFFHLDGFFQAVTPTGEVGCSCAHGQPKEIITVVWQPSHCAHAAALQAVAALGMPEGFGRDFNGENIK
jgi:hypothetical protein